MPLSQPSTSIAHSSPETLKIPLQVWVNLMSSFQCEDVESGKCELEYDAIKSLYTAALVAKNEENMGIWELDGSIFVSSTNASGDEVVTEIVMGRKATLVAAHILKNGAGTTFELSRFFGGADPVNGVRKAIYEINQTLNRYGFFAEIVEKGVYRIVKIKPS